MMLFAPAELHPRLWREIFLESFCEEQYYQWALRAEPGKLVTYQYFRDAWMSLRV